MSLTTSTCITDVGSAILGTTLKIFSNPVSISDNGVFVQDVQTSLITGENCPYTYEIPDGTTTIRIFDPVSFCYVDFNVTESNVCQTCDISFNNVSDNLTGTINVGTLTGSCDDEITNFKISWYGPNDSDNLSFTSGKGLEFPNYTVNHPMNEVNSPLLLPGTYVSRITDVEINGVNYSITGGTGTGSVLSTGLTECFSTFNVNAFNCSNGQCEDPFYTHEKIFITDGLGTQPQSFKTIFELSADTNYFIYRFSGLSKYDNFKITYSGASSTEPLILENINVGSNSGVLNLLTTTPVKSWNNQIFKRILPLSGITTSDGDVLILELTPNNISTDTSWGLRFGCYDNITLNKSCFETYKNSSFKLKKDSLSSNNLSCGNKSISFVISGCTTDSFNELINSSFCILGVDFINTNAHSNTGLINVATFFSQGEFGINSRISTNFGGCISTVGNTITVTKSDSLFQFFFESFSDLVAYKDSFDSTKDYLLTTFVNDPTNINFYKIIRLELPSNTCGEESVCDSCDSFSPERYLHVNSTYVTGTTEGGYYMDITTVPIENGYVCQPCQAGCPDIIVNMFLPYINTTDSEVFSTRTYNNGLRRENPFGSNYEAYEYTDPDNDEYTTYGFLSFLYDYPSILIPSSGNTNTLVPYFSGKTCDLNNLFIARHSFNILSGTDIYTGMNNYTQYFWYFKVKVLTFTPLTYEIYAQQIINYGENIFTNSWIKIYDSVTGVYDPNYVY